MEIKVIRAIVLLIIITSCTFSTCKKGGLNCASTVYFFQIDETVTPDKDSLRIGDTLYLEVNTPSKLMDEKRGTSIDYNNTANLGNVVTLLQFLDSNTTSGAINNFTLFLLKGEKVNSVDPSSQQQVLFTEENGNYVFKLALIPKDTGRYVLTISNAANVYRKNDECTKASFEIDFHSTNQHFYFLNLWRPDLTLDEAGKLKVYYFKVN